MEFVVFDILVIGLADK